MSSLSSSTDPYEMTEFYFMRYFCVILLVFGTCDNTLTICIRTRSKLRSVSSSGSLCGHKQSHDCRVYRQNLPKDVPPGCF